MAGMSKKEVAAIIAAAAAQGVTPVDRKDGVLLRLPDGVATIMLHWSTSDYRVMANTRAEFRRHGLAWPFDDRRATRRKRKKSPHPG